MYINVLRLRPRPFKFRWVSISLCYAKISVFCPTFLLVMWPHVGYVLYFMIETLFEVTTPSRSIWKTLQNCNLLINIFCMCLWTMGLVWCTPAVVFKLYGQLHTDDRPGPYFIKIFKINLKWFFLTLFKKNCLRFKKNYLRLILNKELKILLRIRLILSYLFKIILK